MITVGSYKVIIYRIMSIIMIRSLLLRILFKNYH